MNQPIKIYQSHRDKTMVDELMYIPNDDTQNYPFWTKPPLYAVPERAKLFYNGTQMCVVCPGNRIDFKEREGTMGYLFHYTSPKSFFQERFLIRLWNNFGHFSEF